ncbi:GIY-YIG nuclease family protein [Streptomyces iranensis]
MLISPDPLWSASEVLARPSPIPSAPGVHGWRFHASPFSDLPDGQLPHVGIAPRHMVTRTSTQNLRKRVRYRFRGNAAGSTLRLTLGCLLGPELRRVGSGRRKTFGTAGEAALSQWMAENARVRWVEHPEAWTAEADLIARLDLPLNLDQSKRNAFRPRLKELRAQARQRARERPVTS